MPERKPVVPISDERRAQLLDLAGYVILVRKTADEPYEGYVEQSFGMGFDPKRVNFWWSGEAHSNFGTKHTIDGRESAMRHAETIEKNHPDWSVEVWDAHNEDLPIVIDWNAWADAQAHDPNTLSGVSDKYKARNAPFTVKA